MVLRMQARDAADAVAQAKRLGYSVLSVSARSAGWANRRVHRFASTVFVEQLRELIVAGLSVVEALDTLHRDGSSERAVHIGALINSLREGKTLSQALVEAGEFPDVLIALVRASELTSNLPQALARFLEHERRVTELRDRLTSVAIYPLLLMVVGALVLLFLAIYVVPRFARVFEGMGGELPWSAKVMVAWADLLHSSGHWLLMSGVLLAGCAAAAFTSRKWRTTFWKWLLAFPLIRDRIRTYFLARWYRTTGMLLDGGIPLVSSLQLSNGLLPPALGEGGEAVLQAVRDGLSPSAAHVRGAMATPVAEQLLLAGERAGDLGGVLSRIAHFHEAELARSLERTMRMLEPAVMVLIGLAVGIIVILMYMPIFQLAAAIH
jgi:general secretion pathway protein F